jgi:tetratricopeptide (TPR) repeat protein
MKMLFNRNWLLGLAIVLMTILVYIPAMQGGFVWDDDDYVIENQLLTSPMGLGRIWSGPLSTPQYYPLVFSSFWLEYQLWELWPTGYHGVNVLLHAASALVLWLLLRRLDIPGAWLAAAVFALHPVQVESVAWVTERKNVLSGLFYLISALYLVRFFGVDREEQEQSSHSWWLYCSGLILFLCALLSKTVTCSLPAAIILVLWWKRGRVLWREVAALVPFILLGLALGLLTLWLERHHVGATGLRWELSFLERCLIAGRALWFYAGKLVWPAKLIFNYPRWRIDSSAWWQYAYPMGVFMVVSVLWTFRQRIGRGPLVAVLFFCGTLFPALGFFNTYPMLFSYVADHFQYLASIGLITLAVGGLTRAALIRPARLQQIGVGLGLGVLVLLGVNTWYQSYIYKDQETLWRDTLEKHPNSWLAHNNLGALMVKRGRFKEAINYYSEVLRLKPDSAKTHNNLGGLLETQERYVEAIGHYSEALRLKPDYAEAHNNLGVLYTKLGSYDKAIGHISEALRLEPDYAEAHNNLGVLLMKLGMIRRAVGHYSEAVRLKPDYTAARYNLEFALKTMGELSVKSKREVSP